MMRRLNDWILYLASRLGWAGGAGMLALLAALLTQALLTRPLQSDIVHLESESGRLARQPALAPVPSAQKQLELRLSNDRNTPSAIGRLFDAANEADLSLDEGEYRLVGGQGGEPRRYQITLPLVGSYPSIRQFVGQSLNDNPALALDDLHLSRESVETADLAATVRFSLFLDSGTQR